MPTNKIDGNGMLPEDLEWINRHFKESVDYVTTSGLSGIHIQLNINKTFLFSEDVINDKTSDTKVFITGRSTIAFKGAIPDLTKAKITLSRTGTSIIFYGIREPIKASNLNFDPISTSNFGSQYEFINMTIDDISDLFVDAESCKVYFYNCNINNLKLTEFLKRSKFSFYECKSDKFVFNCEDAKLYIQHCSFPSIDVTCSELDIKEMKIPFSMKINSVFSATIVSSTITEMQDIKCNGYMRYIDCNIPNFKCTLRSNIKSISFDVDTVFSIEGGWQYFASPKIQDVTFYTTRSNDSNTFKDDRSFNNVLKEMDPDKNKLIFFIGKYRQNQNNRNIMQFMEDMIDNGFEQYV